MIVNTTCRCNIDIHDLKLTYSVKSSAKSCIITIIILKRNAKKMCA